MNPLSYYDSASSIQKLSRFNTTCLWVAFVVMIIHGAYGIDEIRQMPLWWFGPNIWSMFRLLTGAISPPLQILCGAFCLAGLLRLQIRCRSDWLRGGLWVWMAAQAIACVPAIMDLWTDPYISIPTFRFPSDAFTILLSVQTLTLYGAAALFPLIILAWLTQASGITWILRTRVLVVICLIYAASMFPWSKSSLAFDFDMMMICWRGASQSGEVFLYLNSVMMGMHLLREGCSLIILIGGGWWFCKRRASILKTGLLLYFILMCIERSMDFLAREDFRVFDMIRSHSIWRFFFFLKPIYLCLWQLVVWHRLRVNEREESAACAGHLQITVRKSPAATT